MFTDFTYCRIENKVTDKIDQQPKSNLNQVSPTKQVGPVLCISNGPTQGFDQKGNTPLGETCFKTYYKAAPN